MKVFFKRHWVKMLIIIITWCLFITFVILINSDSKTEYIKNFSIAASVSFAIAFSLTLNLSLNININNVANNFNEYIKVVVDNFNEVLSHDKIFYNQLRKYMEPVDKLLSQNCQLWET